MRFICFSSLLAANKIKENSSNFNDRWQLRKGHTHLHLFIATDNHILMYKTYEITVDTNEYDVSLKLFVSGVAQCLMGGCKPCLCKVIFAKFGCIFLSNHMLLIYEIWHAYVRGFFVSANLLPTDLLAK
jgi:hypothetical protein